MQLTYVNAGSGRELREPIRLLVFPRLSMPHADSSLIPSNIVTKSEFYEFITPQLRSLLEGQRNWVCLKNDRLDEYT